MPQKKMRRRVAAVATLLIIPLASSKVMQMSGDGQKFEEAASPTEECEACTWAALHAKSVFDSDACVDSSSSLAWQDVLREGCRGDGGCPSLIRRRGVAMAGALLDAVADGDDAEEGDMSEADFQKLICSDYAEVCREHHVYPTVRSVTFTSEASPSMEDVAVYRRGSAQAGDLPAMPTIVITPGKSETQVQRHGYAFKEGYAWRILPMVPVACPGKSVGRDPAKCVVECDETGGEEGTKKDRGEKARKKAKVRSSHGELGAPGAASCRRAERLCDKLKECETVSLSADGSRAYLKQLAVPWDSPTATDIFLDKGLNQRYYIRRNPEFDEAMPIKVPDPRARKPASWDDEEDGLWEAPLVPNTDRLANNPRYIVSKAP